MRKQGPAARSRAGGGRFQRKTIVLWKIITAGFNLLLFDKNHVNFRIKWVIISGLFHDFLQSHRVNVWILHLSKGCSSIGGDGLKIKLAEILVLLLKEGLPCLPFPTWSTLMLTLSQGTDSRMPSSAPSTSRLK
jgi:hypothetical protein